jgi:putative flippase GtrA
MSKMYINYLIVGLGNTLFGYLLLVVFLYIGLHYTFAVFLATVLGVIFNYYTYGRYVFSQESWGLLYKFVIVYFILYLLNIGVMGALINFHINVYTAGFIALLPVAVLGFILNRRYVYAKDD